MDYGLYIGTILQVLITVAVVAGVGSLGVYAERKVLGFLQNRIGPDFVGPFGILQLVADGVKMFTKEDFIPENANELIFRIAPIISVSTVFIALAPIPFFPDFYIGDTLVRPIIADINVGLLFVFAATSVGIYGPLLAGLSSRNKWSILGSFRTVSQFLSFELIVGLSILPIIVITSSLSIVDINNYQGGGITNWLVFKQPIAFVLFVIAGYAEVNRTPFDHMEHEAEVVSGYSTEYSGLRWGLFFVGEYAGMVSLSFLICLLFLGGFNPILFIPGAIAILLKVGFFLIMFLFVRGAWPHTRPDQFMTVCWQILMPIGLVNLLVTSYLVVA